MLRHLNTEQQDGRLRLQYLRSNVTNLTENPLFEYDVTRIAIGLSFIDGAHAAVVGERSFVFDTRSLRQQRDNEYFPGSVKIERMFVVLDEAHGNLAEDVFEALIALKDQYWAKTLYCANKPIHLAESLRKTDGLGWYSTRNHLTARERWPTFRSFEHKIGVYMSPEPDEETVHRDLEHFFTTTVRNPETDKEITSKDGSAVFQLMFPTDFPAENLLAGFRQGTLSACQALWFVLHGLSSSRPSLTSRPRRDREEEKTEGFVQPGY